MKIDCYSRWLQQASVRHAMPIRVILFGVVLFLCGNCMPSFAELPASSSCVIAPVELPVGLAVGDLNGDGLKDIAVISLIDSKRKEVQVFYQKPGCKFGNSLDKVIVMKDPSGIAIGDVDKDGKDDLVVVNKYPPEFHVYLQKENLEIDHKYSHPGFPVSATIADITGNGLADLISRADDGLGPWLRQDRAGSFSLAHLMPKFLKVISDIDGDGVGECVFISNDGKGVDICYGPVPSLPNTRNIRSKDFGRSFKIGLPAAVKDIKTGDFNNDGRVDLAIFAGDELQIFYQNSPAGFTDNASPSAVIKGVKGNWIEVGDFNGNGLVDIAVVDPTYDRAAVCIFYQDKGTGFSNTSKPNATILPGFGIYRTISTDLNNDGVADMIITYDTNYTNPGGGGIKIYINSGKQLSGGDQRTKSEQSADKPQLAEGPPFFTGKILPTPQKVEYLNKFIPVYFNKNKSAMACILISKDGSKDDAKIMDLSRRIQGLGGKIDIIKDGEDFGKYSTIISIGDNKLNAKYLKQNKLIVPDKAEGYLIYPLGEKERNIILCAGHDKLGEYWGIQSLRQLLTTRNGEVYLSAAKVFDYPAFQRRGYAVTYFGHDRLQHFKFAPEYKFNVTFNTPTLFLAQFNGWDSWQETIHKEEMEKIKDIAGYLNQRGISLVLSIHGKTPRVSSTLQTAKNAEIHISEESDVESVASMLKSFLDAGADGIGIWYDDTCFPIYAKDKEKFGDAAHAHAHLINSVHASLEKAHPGFKFFFIPPFYMSNWEYEGLGKYENGNSYLRFLGKNTPSDVEIFWTGPHVISTKVTQESSKQWVELLGRKTAFFDNVFGGPHPGFWYYFDPKDFKTQFPAEFQEFLSTYMMAGYTFGHYRVCLATLSDYLWNPKSYNPEESLKAAIAQIAGPDMYPLLMDWREKVSKFDQFGEGNVSPGAQNMLPQLRMWLEELKISFEQVKQQCRNPLVVSGMGWHTDFWEKFVAKVEKASTREYEKAVAQVRDQAYKETGAKADDILIAPYDFIGGCKGFTGGIAKNERRHAVWVYGTKNASQMSSDFNLPASSIKDCKLVISGFVSDKSFRMRILVNNNPIFEGMDKDSGFNNEKWIQKEFLLKSNFLKVGKNKLLIENLEDKGFIGADPWFMLNYAVIKK